MEEFCFSSKTTSMIEVKFEKWWIKWRKENILLTQEGFEELYESELKSSMFQAWQAGFVFGAVQT
jgi:hypothetical protein